MARLDEFFDCGKLGLSSLQCPQEMLGKYRGGKCAVVAGAACVWDDLAALGLYGDGNNNGYHVLCVNDIYMHYPGAVQHLYSNDRKMIPFWLGARRHQYTRHGWMTKDTHTIREGGARWSWPWPGHGTSTLNAVYTALALGYDRIVVCGAPLDNTPHYFDPPWMKTTFDKQVPEDVGGQLTYWSNAAKMFRGKVKSMSGRSRDVLGAP